MAGIIVNGGIVVGDFNSVLPTIDNAAYRQALDDLARQKGGPPTNAERAALSAQFTIERMSRTITLLRGQESLAEQFLSPSQVNHLTSVGAISGEWLPAGVDGESPAETKLRVDSWIAANGVPSPA